MTTETVAKEEYIIAEATSVQPVTKSGIEAWLAKPIEIRPMYTTIGTQTSRFQSEVPNVAAAGTCN